MTPKIFTVAEFKKENRDVFTLRLVSEAGDESTPFEPGQFNMLYAFGAGEAAISISASGKGFTHTIRNVGSVTGLLARLKVGDQVGVRGPFGQPWPISALRGRDVLLLAGGIGLAPLRPVLHSLREQRRDFGRISLLYGARTPDDLLYQDELQELAHDHAFDVQVTVDQALPPWKGRVGVVPALIAQAPVDFSNTVALMCGPEIMMRFAVDELLRLGMDPSAIYLSLERSMKCGIGHCGHCQFAPFFLCKDGPVFSFNRLKPFFGKKEL